MTVITCQNLSVVGLVWLYRSRRYYSIHLPYLLIYNMLLKLCTKRVLLIELLLCWNLHHWWGDEKSMKMVSNSVKVCYFYFTILDSILYQIFVIKITSEIMWLLLGTISDFPSRTVNAKNILIYNGILMHIEPDLILYIFQSAACRRLSTVFVSSKLLADIL